MSENIRQFMKGYKKTLEIIKEDGKYKKKKSVKFISELVECVGFRFQYFVSFKCQSFYQLKEVHEQCYIC